MPYFLDPQGTANQNNALHYVDSEGILGPFWRHYRSALDVHRWVRCRANLRTAGSPSMVLGASLILLVFHPSSRRIVSQHALGGKMLRSI
jgi:hypothetical protein